MSEAVASDMAARLPGEAETPGLLAERHLSLATMPAERGNRRAALIIVTLSASLFLAAVPFATVPLAQIPAFIPIYESALLLNDLITALLLFGQFSQLRSYPLLALAAGYLFDAFMIIPHALTFPGVFAPTGLLGAGVHSTAWLYTFWHGGFPLFILLYSFLKERQGRGLPLAVSRNPLAAIAGAIAGVALLAAGLTLIATQGHDWLPPMMSGNGYAPALVYVIGTVWTFSLAALLALLRRRGSSVIDLWLSVVMCAWLFDIALSAVLNAGRYDLGFYAGRAYGLVAASFVLAVLLLETNGLYGRLATASDRLEDYAHRLEGRVRERTADLSRSNEMLRSVINERERTAAQLVHAQKMEAIGNLTGGMAHDFNNLLGVIIGNLDVLRATRKGDAEVEELGGEALDAALRGADLTRRLLAFARRQPLQPELIDVNEHVGAITKLLARTLGERVELVVETAPGIWPVLADPAQLEAAITNLATNARDAMPRGGKLAIATGNRQLDADYASLHPEVVPGDYAMIEVSDNGTGIPQDLLGRIFEPFFTTKEKDKGTGLGLSQVFGYMKQSGGHVSVYSEVGSGTTFRLYLPRAAIAGAAEQRAPVKEAPAGHGEIVLAVEDNVGMRRIVLRQLGELGYRAWEAENAAAALAILEREPIDILLTDIMMPGELSGLDLARHVAKRWPKMRVILTSGFPGAKIEGGLSGDGLTRILSKPYRRDDLARALRQALAR